MSEETTETVLYTEEEKTIITNIATITNDFKKALSSEEENDVLKMKKIIKKAQLATNPSYFNLDDEREAFDYNEAVAYYCCSELLALKNSISFALGGDNKSIKAGMLEIKRNNVDGTKSYDDNYYLNEWRKIIKKYFEKKNGSSFYCCCAGAKRFKL